MPAAKNRNFEAELKKLESIVSSMEQGELSLDEAMKLYQTGMEISRFCMKYLSEAETKVEILNRNGSLRAFAPEEDAAADEAGAAAKEPSAEGVADGEEEDELLF